MRLASIIVAVAVYLFVLFVKHSFSIDCPGTPYVDQTGLITTRDHPASTFMWWNYKNVPPLIVETFSFKQGVVCLQNALFLASV